MDTWMWVFVGVAGLYQLIVSAFVVRALEYGRSQKLLQLGLIWIVPVLGAAVAHVFMWSHRTGPRERDKNFTPEDIGSA